MWKRVLIGVGVVAVVVLGVLRYMRVQTQQLSPEETATFYIGGPEGVQVVVDYCRPSKRGRVIFGGLVPYGKVWRTGANEATTFSANKEINFGGTPLKAGTYTMWTLPSPDAWVVYLNSKSYPWGVDMDGNAQRDPAADVAAITIPVKHVSPPLEQFTIALDEAGTAMELKWDDVLISIPITY